MSAHPSGAPTEAPPLSSRAPQPLLALLIRLHLYVGLLVGPFIFVAALSGLIYALTPQLENQLYARELFTDSRGSVLPLAEQIRLAQAQVGGSATLSAVRPAPEPGTTTRVMFRTAESAESQSRALFVDPVSGAIRGDLLVYGTSGVLPLRTWLDQLHRSLLLGEPGRLYSELAASWLWVAALGGLLLWLLKRRRTAAAIGSTRLRHLHKTLGLWLLVGLLFFSATGLTWSRLAGDNIGVARAALGMGTPSVSTALSGASEAPAGEHAHHAGMAMPMGAAKPGDPTLFDPVLRAARQAGIDANKLEIVPASGPDRAWTVTEIDRSWPTQVDAVAIDPRTMQVTDRIDFATFPIAAKLTRWGIDAHMGSLFGLANQLLLAATALGLATLVVLGYLMWWRRRRTARRASVIQAFGALSPRVRVMIMAGAVLFGVCLPVLGASLLLFLVIKALLDGMARLRDDRLRQPG